MIAAAADQGAAFKRETDDEGVYRYASDGNQIINLRLKGRGPEGEMGAGKLSMMRDFFTVRRGFAKLQDAALVMLGVHVNTAQTPGGLEFTALFLQLGRHSIQKIRFEDEIMGFLHQSEGLPGSKTI